MWVRLPASVQRKAAAVRAVQSGADFEPAADLTMPSDDHTSVRARAGAIPAEGDRALRGIGVPPGPPISV